MSSFHDINIDFRPDNILRNNQADVYMVSS